MNINFLYITFDFPPTGMQIGIRALEISKRLIKENIYPIILTKKIEKNELFNYSLIHEIPPSLKIYRTSFYRIKNKYILYLMQLIFKFDFYLGWIPFAYSKAKKILRKQKNINFIYAAGPPFSTHIIGYLIKRKFKIPLVLEYNDPWSFSPYNEKAEPWLNKRINLVLEKRITQSSDIIISLSSIMNSFLKIKFPTIKNKSMFSIDGGMNLRNIDEFPKKNNQEITFTFTGSLYGKRDIIPFLKIISALKKENFFKKFKFKIKIFGKYIREYLEHIIKKLKIEDLIFLGDFIPRSETLTEILKSDLALHIGENLNYPTLSFKIWDYLSCRKKILYLGREDSYTADFLKKNELGIIIPINNLPKGKKILKNLLNDIKNDKFNSEIEEKKLIKFSWDNKARKFKNIIVKNIVK